MNRIQFIEILDFPWVPRSLRQASMAYLRLMLNLTGHARCLLPKLTEALRQSGARQICDLCSGGGGPWPSLAPELERQGIVDSITLSDLHPDRAAYALVEKTAPAVLRGSAQAVDATKVPADRTGLRTMFNAFHHFPPALAAKVLQDAVDARAPIAIFEVAGRDPVTLLGMLSSPLPVLLLTPFLRPFRLSFLLLTYVLPVFPLLATFDGVVSALRVYSPAELTALLTQLRDPGYRWDIGRIKLGSAPAHATYLIGYPPEARSA